VYDTDKFVWLQARQVWTYAKNHNEISPKKDWLNTALLGADFLEKNGRDQEDSWYFSLNREGKPLVQPYNIFSDCFATMAFGQLSTATKEDRHAEIAYKSFQNIIRKSGNPKGSYNKIYPGTRDLENFALPMIMCNLVMEIEHLLEPHLVKEHLDRGIYTVLDKFYKPEYGLILENIGLDGQMNDSFQGRLINPGHGLESMWFLMDIGEKYNDPALIQKCVEVTLSTLDFGWDKEFGGIFYFMDLKGNPTEQLEWNQKLWWPHIEAMIACLKGFQLTGNEDCWKWFEKLYDYCWSHFVDTQNGEWYGYLSREGELNLDLKGGKWKGCFHVPRGLFHLWQVMEKLEKSYED